MVDIANEHNGTTPPGAGPILRPRRTPETGDVRPDRTSPVTPSATNPPSRSATAVRYLLAGIRLALGWIFLWAFLDKVFGLGHSTASAKSWLNGGSPTKGFLGSATEGPFAGFYHSIAGVGVVDVLFMATLLGVGVALILGIGMRVAAGAGALLTVMMWTAVLPPASNPFMDDHLVYAAVLIVLALLGAGDTLGLGRQWSSLPLVRRATWLK